jgi:hypothetical protein
MSQSLDGRMALSRQALAGLMLWALAPLFAQAQQSSISAYDAADFRIWGYIPYWDDTKVSGFATSGIYSHVSDVLFFGSARPDATGVVTNLYPNTTNTLRSQSTTYGFKLHLSMMAVSGGQGVDATWRSIAANPAYRAKFISDVKDLITNKTGTTADDMKGFNFDWERPATDDEWGNYTQLARELKAALNPNGNEGREVSVCDYGSTDSDWDDTALFDAKVYDQLMMMVYHINATSTNTWAQTKYALTGQGAAKAFSKDQVAVGVGTWGTGGPSTVGLKDILAVSPNLAYDALSYTGTVNGSTGTWTIESRKQVREKTQYALDNGMPGMFTWDMTYDAAQGLGLHRVMHHYMVVKRNIPDVNLDGRVNATDANALADQMGTVPGWTGMDTAARFDTFYVRGNWEKGDHDGNGFVNQADADWLAGRYATLGVILPDRLAYTGTFENFASAKGITGRWQAKRETGGNLRDTGNYTQHGSGNLTWSGTGVGADKHSSTAVTLRNQNAAEAYDTLNTLPRIMQANLTTPIDLSQNQTSYFTFLVRENTASLLSSQLTSDNRTLSLVFADAAGTNQFDFALRGRQQQFAIESQADTAGQDVVGGGFTSNAAYLVVGKISGNGTGANTMQASIFASGAAVANFTDPSFQWMLTAQGSAGYNPVITNLQFTSLYEANYTVSNVWIGDATTMLPPTLTSQGDFNRDGVVTSADYMVWRKTMGQTGSSLLADGNGNYVVDSGDLNTWRAHFGMAVSGAAEGSGLAAVPEPAAGLLCGIAAAWLMCCTHASFRGRRVE